MEPFSDRVSKAIDKNQSVLVAGIDPDIDLMPEIFRAEAQRTASNDEDFFRRALTSFYLPALEAIGHTIAAIKPNLAFFEQYGIGGLRAYQEISAWGRKHGILVIADAKRGDIGSTAAAYAAAFFGPRSAAGKRVEGLFADALTVNPFLGFDTLEPFVTRAAECGAGIFILARTSNPGSGDLQAVIDSRSKCDISATVAGWIAKNSERLKGACGLSGLGAVVGATHPTELRRLRERMPESLFLIPGYGAQGGSAEDISQARAARGNGILVNSSRGIFGGISQDASATETLKIISERVAQSNGALASVR